MSLIGSIHTTFSGIRTTEAKMATVTSNVTNADAAGYTKKTYQSSYTTANGIMTPSGGTVVGSLDAQLYKSTINDVTDKGYYSTLASYLDAYSTSLGTTSGASGLSTALNDLETQISALATSPEDSSQKINVVDAAETLARTLNDLSSGIQGQRLQADQEIANSVTAINNALTTIDTLNQKILSLQAQGASTADLEDQRMVALEGLAEQIDVAYFFDSSNQLKIYTSSGQPLLTSQPQLLSYEPATSVTSQTEYPGGFGAITVGGQDITGKLQGGTLGALVELRDETLVAEQDKLDELADALSSTMNAILNEGTSYPPRSSITGDVRDFTAGDTFSATGTLRIAVTDQSGMVQSVTDLDLSAYTTVGDLVTALDGLAGVQASIDTGTGKLVLSAENSGEGLSFNQMDSSVGAGGDSFGVYFGVNNLFTGEGAEYIQVSKYLSDNPQYLATAQLSSAATLASGDRGISGGDGTTAEALSAAMTGKVSFGAAGNFAAQTVTFNSYTGNIVSSAATSASTAATEADTAELVYTQTKALLENQTGVNLDEETAKLMELENHYQTSALLLSTIQDMFDALIAALR